MWTILFVFTFGVVVLNLWSWIPSIFGNSWGLPTMTPIVDTSPNTPYILYPSFFYQVWFWTDKLQIIV